MRVVVLGGGVAGASLALSLLEFYPGAEVEVVEPRGYRYPCGEAVPYSAFELGGDGGPVVEVLRKHVMRRIRGFRMCVSRGGRDEEKVDCVGVDYGYDVGAIIDKYAFVEDLRRRAERRGARFIRGRARSTVRDCVFVDATRSIGVGWQVCGGRMYTIVDARGPFSESPEYEKLAVVRGFARGRAVTPMGDEIGRDEIYFYFDAGFMGYYWVFPAAREPYDWNVGIGMTSEDLARLSTAKYSWGGSKPTLHTLNHRLSRIHGLERVEGEQGKKIKVARPSRAAVDGRIVRIGEAGGFIVPYTGEGIRPAIESAIALAVDLTEEERPGRRLKALAKAYERHHLVFWALRRLGPRASVNFITTLKPEDYLRLLGGEPLSLTYMARLGAKLAGSYVASVIKG